MSSQHDPDAPVFQSAASFCAGGFQAHFIDSESGICQSAAALACYRFMLWGCGTGTPCEAVGSVVCVRPQGPDRAGPPTAARSRRGEVGLVTHKVDVLTRELNGDSSMVLSYFRTAVC